ncbi:glycoside hydrolase domain-containing protein [Actinopolymorpha sp. B11F2]|uniref:glycoside hydrolase domain-containing protein n=1 Tax=Actinopolymorpha sp. B11F2 TaxID=3160862 RepID=UPI0032E4FBCB
MTYRGLRLDVPSSWAVHDLEARPRTCVRFDVPALYLGTPGADQDCPHRAVGRSDGLLVAPATGGEPDGTLAVGAAPAPAGTAPTAGNAPAGAGAASVDTTPTSTASEETTHALAGIGLAVTAAYGGSPEVVTAILERVQYTGPERTTPTGESADLSATSGPAGSSPAPMFSDPTRIGSGANTPRHLGRGFDTCTAPSLTTMRAWLASPYRTVGIYIGGVNRACPDGNLSASWVRSSARLGWQMLPIYVGRQAPCAFQDDLGPIRPTNVAQQGAAAAVDATRRAQRFGLYGGSTIYFDLEAYDTGNTGCRRTVMQFLHAWTTQLHDSGYLSGVYSSAASGIRDLSDAYGSSSFARPDAIWTARWDGRASVWGEPHVPDSQWGTHQRLKQYRGGHNETWGGRRLNIDSNMVDGPLGSVRYQYAVTSRIGLRARSGPGTSYPMVGVWAPGASLDLVCQAIGTEVGTTRVWDKLLNGSYVSDLHVSTASQRGMSPPVPLCRYPYPVSTSVLRVRSGAGTSYPAVGVIRTGGLAYITCQQAGSQVGPGAVWNQLDSGGWVADAYVLTPGRPGYSRPIPRCAAPDPR